MSKSETSDASRINMTDDADLIAKKIRKAKTDPFPLPATVGELEGRPEADNLITIYAGLADISREETCRQFGGQSFSVFKAEMVDVAVDKLTPIAAEMRRLLADPGAIDQVLKEGAEKARALSQPILDQVYDIVGLLRS